MVSSRQHSHLSALTLPFQSWSGKLKGASAKCVLPQMSRLLQRIEYSSGQRRRCGRRCRRPNNNSMMKELLWFSLSASLSASVQRWVHNKCHCLSIGCYGLVIDFVKLTIMRSIYHSQFSSVTVPASCATAEHTAASLQSIKSKRKKRVRPWASYVKESFLSSNPPRWSRRWYR